MMQLTEAVSVFTNPEAQANDKLILAVETIRAEIRVRPSLEHLFSLVSSKSYEVNEDAPLPDLADELGFLKAEIKNLENAEEKIKEILHISGEKTVDGAYFTATVGEDYTNTTISLVELAKKAPKVYKLLEEFLKRTPCIGRITVRARG